MDRRVQVGSDRESNPGVSIGPQTTDVGGGSPSEDRFLREAAAVPTSVVGRTFEGRYTVIKELGRGGMGVVYVAEDTRLHRSIALKVMRADLVRDRERRARFLREARAASSVTHPNIAVVHDVGESDDDVFLAMELVEGESLRARLQAGPLGNAEAVRIGIAIARGLGAAHEGGIVHRDVKPENVMIGRNNVVKVLDFGLAKSLASDAPRSGDASTALETEAGTVLGTPSYMSPEQAKGGLVDARSDVFSLGVLLYELLSGERPFRGATSMEILIAIDRDAPAPLRKVAPEVPHAIARTIMRCLAKDPSERFPNGRDAASALAEASQAPRPSARFNGVILLVAACAIAVIGVGGRALMSRRGARGAASVSPSPLAIRPIDLPMPESTNAEAKAAYAAGVAKMYAGTWDASRKDFDRAVAVEPGMAAAHLRLAIYGAFNDPVPGREHFAMAYALRDRLTERDRELIEAIEPIAGRLKADKREAAKRLDAFRERHPTDTETYLLLAIARTGDPELMIKLTDEAIRLDPGYADAWQERGLALFVLGRNDEAVASLRRSAETSLIALDALSWLAHAYGNAGNCSEMERVCRQMVDRGIASDGNACFANVLFARGASEATVREAHLRSSAANDPRPWLGTKRWNAKLAAAIGEFDVARDALHSALKDAEVSAELYPRYAATLDLVRVELETGNHAEAGRIALDFARRYTMWSHPASVEGANTPRIPWLLGVAAREANLAHEELERSRAEWMEEARDLEGAQPYVLWAFAHAAAAETPAEIADALARKPLGPPMMSLVALENTDAMMGHFELLAGNLDAAVERLRRGAGSCLPLDSPMLHTWAHFDLGVALERKGDVEGACAAYRVVLARWGRSGSRSVTAKEASEHAKALRCPG